MCGIGWILLRKDESETLTFIEQLASTLSRRGPDLLSSPYNIDISELSNNYMCSMICSVLHMRGSEAMPQPIIRYCGENLYVLGWNGECYDGPCDAMTNQSDTLVIFDLLRNAIRDSEGNEDNILDSIASAIGRVKGEYAFIFHHRSGSSAHRVYFGRDYLGRRSLLVHHNFDSGNLVLTSCQPEKKGLKVEGNIIDPEDRSFLEVLPGRLYCLDVATMNITDCPIKKLANEVNCNDLTEEASSTSRFPCTTPTSNWQDDNVSPSMAKAALELHQKLDAAVRRRVLSVPTEAGSISLLGVLFSGGLDSVVLAALANNHVPSDEPIELINVSFSATPLNGKPLSTYSVENSPDRLAALLSYQELQQRFPLRVWRLIAVDVGFDEVLMHESKICSLISPLDSQMDFNIGAAMWFASRSRGWVVDDAAMHEFKSSAMLRFAQDASTPKHVKTMCSREGCDKQALNECVFRACRLCCKFYQKPINQFLGAGAKVCTAHNTTKKSKAKNKKHSIPGKSASMRTEEVPEESGEATKQPMYDSCVKALLLGIGADEQMAGYGRHRSVYGRGGYAALQVELQMEKRRIWTRNLGRDDRCVSDNGKEARFPFLDEEVVEFLDNLPITDICDMDRVQGEGDKMILRLVAKLIGVHVCSTLVKRAIQFGSRIAKASDVHQFGSSRHATGTAKYKGGS